MRMKRRFDAKARKHLTIVVTEVYGKIVESGRE
jgi:hypothetical protein